MADITVDNCMEWITGSKTGSITFSQKRWVNKLLKYAEEYPEDVKILARNEDGSVFAHVPVSWFKFSPPRKGRELTEEEKAIAAERMRAMRDKRSGKRAEND